MGFLKISGHDMVVTMAHSNITFSRGQLMLLSALQLFDRPVTASVLDVVAPLASGQLLELVKPGGPVHIDPKGRLSLSARISGALKSKLDAMATPAFARQLLIRLPRPESDREAYADLHLSLLSVAGIEADEVIPALEKARGAVARGAYDEGLNGYVDIIRCLESAPHRRNHRGLFIIVVLEYSDISLMTGNGGMPVLALLQKAEKMAEISGDQRSRALLYLHMGRVLFFVGREAEAVSVLKDGIDQVRELGDPDILDQACIFIGFYYSLLGRHREAIEYLETTLTGSDDLEGMKFKPMARIVFGYTAAFIGHFNRAVGTLDFSWQLARQGSHPIMASAIRAVLGVVLTAAGKIDEGYHHLEGANQDAIAGNNPLGRNLALRGLAYNLFIQKRMEEAAETVAEFEKHAIGQALGFQYLTPWMLEMSEALENLGLTSDWRWRFDAAFERIMQSQNIHIQGVALRLRARRMKDAGTPTADILPLLIRSEACLEEAGDPVQLAKCQSERAMLHLSDGDTQESRKYARKGYQGIVGYDESLFPDELRPFLDIHSERSLETDPDGGWKDMLAAAVGRISPEIETDVFLSRMLFVLNRFFQNERAGFFRMADSGFRLCAARNLTRKEIEQGDFSSGMAAIREAMRSGRLRLLDATSGQTEKSSRPVSALCLPVHVGGDLWGILYQDSSAPNNRYRRKDPGEFDRISDCLGSAIGRNLAYNRLIRETKTDAIAKTARAAVSHEHDIVIESREMLGIMSQAGKAAATDTSVLLLGETGTGKEVVARWIHDNSARRDKPFIVIEPAVIPENIVESELFGHERGAFTGADRQKTGLVELAHGGTLFIDEVGEIPTVVQVKLLRLLQEKAFTRVGGAKTIRSDFRLISATNRTLQGLIADGRFREDLYYRINVLELMLPPLRNRGEDIHALASHFLARFARKYDHEGLVLSKRDLRRLKTYHWPGNVRELKNVIERSVFLSERKKLQLDHALPSVRLSPQAEELFHNLPSMDEVQRRYIRHVLAATGGKIAGTGGAAEILGMKRTTLQARMKKLKVGQE